MARGTRRPHVRRVRSAPSRRVKGGGGGKGMSCALFLLASGVVLLSAAAGAALALVRIA